MRRAATSSASGASAFTIWLDVSPSESSRRSSGFVAQDRLRHRAEAATEQAAGFVARLLAGQALRLQRRDGGFDA